MKLDALLKLPSAPAEFLCQTDTVELRMLIREYARYMLDQAGVSGLPVDIDAVVNYHGFKQLKALMKEPMDRGRRGMQIGSALAVNTDDPRCVQRFSKGHELTEALVKALQEEVPSRYSKQEWEALEQMKEHLCDYGGAEFVLPAHLFFPRAELYKMKLEHAVVWARDCEASLTATVRRMLDANVGPGIFLIVQERSPRYYGSLRNTYDMIWNDTTSTSWKPHADAELHVVREWHSPQTKTMVKLNEVIPRETSIYRTYKAGITNQVERCNEVLPFTNLAGYQPTETILVKIKNISTPTVMALIHPRELR